MLGLCERFGCLPSQLYEEDGELWRLMQIEALGRPVGAEGGELVG